MPVQNAGPFGWNRPRGVEGTRSRSWLTVPGRAMPGRALRKAAAPPVVQLRLRALCPVPNVAPGGERTGGLLSVIFLESVSVRCADR